MPTFKAWFHQIRVALRDDNFLRFLSRVEGWVSKLLSVVMLFVILLSVYQLVAYLIQELISPPPSDRYSRTLFTIFGLFLNVLIALEILENITAYLKKHVIQVELVIVTSLIAVARKIIILDLEKTAGLDLLALAAAIVSLSLSYWIIRNVRPQNTH